MRRIDLIFMSMPPLYNFLNLPMSKLFKLGSFFVQFFLTIFIMYWQRKHHPQRYNSNIAMSL
jgi:hypothetical protein